MFGLTRGEILLVAFIFALIYGAGLLPKLIGLIAPAPKKEPRDLESGEND